jgi:acyl carrier protein
VRGRGISIADSIDVVVMVLKLEDGLAGFKIIDNH